MNPDSFIPLYGNDFFMAIEGHPDQIGTCYLRAIWFYWHHNHCKGIQDNDEFLRKICRVEKPEWPPIRDIIFDNDKFFTQDADGLWHQKRASDEWVIAKAKYESAIKRGLAGAAKRWKKKK